MWHTQWKVPPPVTVSRDNFPPRLPTKDEEANSAIRKHLLIQLLCRTCSNHNDNDRRNRTLTLVMWVRQRVGMCQTMRMNGESLTMLLTR